MKRGVTLITPTGDRPEALALCSYYMQRQTVPYNQWLVIDDGNMDIPISILPPSGSVEVHKRSVSSVEPPHSLILNLMEALPLIQYNKVLFIEDDDWYSPTYIEFMLGLFGEGFQLVGQNNSVYYHVPTMAWHKCGNKSHVSLCQTGFTTDSIDWVALCLGACHKAGTNYLDIELWKNPVRKHPVYIDYCYCLGMKGLPGRKGIGVGHHRFSHYTKDKDLNVLHSYIGNDVRLYKRWMI